MKKILKFIAVYLCITILTAVGVVLVYNPSNKNTADVGDVSGNYAPPTAIENVLNGVMSAKGLEISIRADVNQTDGEDFIIFSDITLDMTNGFANLAMSGNVNVEIGEDEIHADIAMVDGYLYVSALDGKFKISTDNLMSSIGQILDMVGVDMGSFDMSALDLNSIMSMFNDLTPVETDNGYLMQMQLFGYDININTDKDYKISSVTLGSIVTGNMAITPVIYINYNDEIEPITAPEGKYIDLSNVLNLVSAFKNLVKDSKLAFVGKIFVEQNEYQLDTKIDFANGLKAQVHTNVFDRDICATVIDNVIYFDIDNIHFYFDINDKDDIVSVLSKMGIDVSPYIEYINQLLSFDLGSIDMSQIDISALSLAMIKDIVIDEDSYTVSIDGIGDIVLVADDTISKIILDNELFDLDIAFVPVDFEIGVNDWQYQNLTNICDTILAIYNTAQYSTFEGVMNVNVQSTNCTITYQISYNDVLVGKFAVSVFGEKIDIAVVGQEIYVSVKDINIHAQLSDLQSIIDSLKINASIDYTSVLESVVASINSVLNTDNIANLIQQFEYTNNTMYIDLACGIKMSIIDNGDTLNSIYLECDQFTFDMDITASNETVECDVDESKFVELNDLEKIVNNLKDYLQSDNYYFYVDINILGYNINGYIGYNGKITANLQTVIYGKVVNVKICDDVIYIVCESLHFKVNIEDLPQLIDYVTAKLQEYGVQVPTIDDSVIEQLSQMMTQIKLNDVIEIINNLDVMMSDKDIQISYQDIDVTIALANYFVQSINITYGENSVYIQPKDTMDQVLVDSNTYYVDLVDLLPVADKVMSLLQTTNYTGTARVNIQGVDIDLDYHIEIVDGSIRANISTTFYGLDIVVTYIDDTLYLYLDGLNVYANTDEISDIISWINTTFDTNIEDITNKTIKIEDIKIDFVKNISIFDTRISITTTANDIINIDFSNGIYIDALYSGISIDAKLMMSDKDIVLDDSVEYEHYTTLTRMIDSIIDTVRNRQVSMNAQATVYSSDDVVRYQAQGRANIDLNSPYSLFSEVTLSGEQDMEFNLAYSNDRLYVNYDKLKVSFDKDCLVEIAYILCETFGISTDGVGLFEDIISSSDIADVDMSNIQALIPAFDATQPLSMLRFVKGMNLQDDKLILVLDGVMLSSNSQARDVNISLQLENNKLKQLVIKDFYTGVTGEEHFDLDITLQEFVGVGQVQDPDSYMDLSDVSGLLSAIVSTSTLDDFHITANLNIDISLLNDPITVPIDIQVKLVDGKPQVMATVGPIPVIAPIDNDVPYKFGDTVNGIYCGVNRILKIYYMDGYVYFYRSEEVPRFASRNRTFEKKLKVTLEELLEDPMMVLSYGCGFQDIIMDEINKAVDKAINRTEPMNMSNILLGFDYNDNDTYSLTLNLREIANNHDLDTMTITLSTNKVQDSNYITSGTLYMNMPISSAFELSLQSNDLTLCDIGRSLDFSEMYNFVNNYTYKVDEKWVADNGSWSMESATVYTVYFEENGGYEVANVTGAIDTEFDLPNYQDRIVDDSITKTVYQFAGWYTTPTFDKGSEYQTGRITRGDLTLYAKWDCYVYYYHTISFVDNIGQKADSICNLTGTVFSVPTYDQITISSESITTTYQFVGWYTDANCTYLWQGNTIPDYDVTLYAKWDIVDVVETKLVNIYDNNVLVASVGKVVGDNLELTSSDYQNINNDTLWYLDSEYKNAYTLPEIMPDSELNIHIRNRYVVSFCSQYGDTTTKTYNMYQGETITLPVQNDYYYDDGTQTQRTYYDYQGYDNVDNVVPNYNITINAIWVVDVKLYYTVTFDMSLNYIPKDCASGCDYKTAPQSISAIKMLEGSTLDLTDSKYQVTCTIWATAIHWGVNYSYRSTTWGTSVHANYQNGGDGFTSIVITQDITLYPYWEKI